MNMVTTGTMFQCTNCSTEVEIVNAEKFGGPLVCCEIEMEKMKDYDELYEQEAYDPTDFQWD